MAGFFKISVRISQVKVHHKTCMFIYIYIYIYIYISIYISIYIYIIVGNCKQMLLESARYT